jgi:hypothetical protein
MPEHQAQPEHPTQPSAPLSAQMPRWKPWIAAGLSLGFPGLGHLFLRSWLRAFAFLLPNYFLYTISDYWPNGILINIICMIFSAVDAYSISKNGRGIF